MPVFMLLQVTELRDVLHSKFGDSGAQRNKDTKLIIRVITLQVMPPTWPRYIDATNGRTERDRQVDNGGRQYDKN